MTVSVAWFIGLLIVGLAMYLLGRRLGRCHRAWVYVAFAIAVTGIAASAGLRFRPVLLHQYIPLDISIWLEGIVGLFPWMLLVGLLQTGAMSENLKRAAPLMFVLGLVYFLFGGIWMVLPTITVGEPENLSPSGVIIQNRHDTCVPTSCANALRVMGIPASEGRMCSVVLAKPGRGSSLARAAWGLRSYVSQHDLTVSLEDLSADEVLDAAGSDRPALVVIRSGVVADHMVVVMGRTGDGNALIINPSPGEHGGVPALPVHLGYGFEVFSPADFARLYRRGAILFHDMVPPLPDQPATVKVTPFPVPSP